MNWETPFVCKRLAVKNCLLSLKVVILNKSRASSKLTKLLFNYNGTIIQVTFEDIISLRLNLFQGDEYKVSLTACEGKLR